MIVGIVLGSVAAVMVLVGGVLALTWSSAALEQQKAKASIKAASDGRSETRKMISDYEHKHGSVRRPIVVVGKDGKRTFAKNVNRRTHDPNYTAIWNYLIKEIDIKKGHELDLHGCYSNKRAWKVTVRSVSAKPPINDTDYVISGRQTLDKLKWYKKKYPDHRFTVSKKQRGIILRAEWTVIRPNRRRRTRQKRYFVIDGRRVIFAFKEGEQPTNWSQKLR